MVCDGHRDKVEGYRSHPTERILTPSPSPMKGGDDFQACVCAAWWSEKSGEGTRQAFWIRRRAVLIRREESFLHIHAVFGTSWRVPSFSCVSSSDEVCSWTCSMKEGCRRRATRPRHVSPHYALSFDFTARVSFALILTFFSAASSIFHARFRTRLAGQLRLTGSKCPRLLH